MTKDQLKIIFIGTPDFAVASLAAILDNGFNVVAVVTAPDKPAGRGLKMQESAVKSFAVSRNIPVLQPPRLKAPEFIEELKSYQADIQVVIAFRMLPELVWNMPRFGTFNLHASLLPAYRGAAPINRAIMNGEKETGVSTFFLEHEIDTGNLIFTEKLEIGEEETAGELHDRLMQEGAGLVVKTLNAVLQGNYPQIPQSTSENLPVAPKIFKEDCLLDPNWPVKKIHNHIRGLSPYPGAFTSFREKQLKIFRSSIIDGKSTGDGQFEIRDRKQFIWHVSDGLLNLLEVQLEGKKRMMAEEFLRGIQS